MLKFLTRTFYDDKIYTSEPKLFYKLYKWEVGLPLLLSLRRIFSIILFSSMGITWMIFIQPRIIGLYFFDVAVIVLYFVLRDFKKLQIDNNILTPYELRTLKLNYQIRKFVSLSNKAFGLKGWRAIKRQDIKLYHNLLCEKCRHCCYFYSLEIARIIKDSTLIWGSIEEPLEDGHNHYAHAFILRNGYIYDTNMRQSEKYKDFVKLYNFKLYKEWSYDEYSREDFRGFERANFQKWCQENNVLVYEKF